MDADDDELLDDDDVPLDDEEDVLPDEEEELLPGVMPPLEHPCNAKNPAAINTKEIFFIITILTN